MRFLTLFLILCLLDSCAHKKTSIDYYIFSKIDSINSIWKFDSNNNQFYPPPPPPPPPPPLSYYSGLVMIFDTSNRIYLYQTECIYKDRSIKKSYKIPSANYLNFIGLNPDQLLSIKSEYLIDFLTDNDRYFKLDTNYHESNRFFFIVSDYDTITNIGYYMLLDHIKSDRSKRGNIFYSIRRTTEEEKNVLYCLRSGKLYEPQNFKWSNNFLDGQTTPLTSRYDSIDNLMLFSVKSRDLFRPNSINIKPIL
jgi:hypothetical protein